VSGLQQETKRAVAVAVLAVIAFPLSAFIFAGFDRFASFGMEPEPFVTTYLRGVWVAAWIYAGAALAGIVALIARLVIR
jgi:ABC-type multidrug transport system permease subunit